MAASSRDIYSDRSVLMAAGTLAAAGAWASPVLMPPYLLVAIGLGLHDAHCIAISPEASSEESVRCVSRIGLLSLTVMGAALVGLGGGIGARALSRMVSVTPSDLWGFLHELLLVGSASSLVCYGGSLLRSHVVALHALCRDDAGRRRAIAHLAHLMVDGGASMRCYELACALLTRSEEDDAPAVLLYTEGLIKLAHDRPSLVVAPVASLTSRSPAFLEKARAHWMHRVEAEGSFEHGLQTVALLTPLQGLEMAEAIERGLCTRQRIGSLFVFWTERQTEQAKQLRRDMEQWKELEREARREISAAHALLMASPPDPAHMPPPCQRSAKEVALQVGEFTLCVLLFAAGYQKAPYVTALSVLVGCFCAGARLLELSPAARVLLMRRAFLVVDRERERAASLSGWSQTLVRWLWPTFFARRGLLDIALFVSNVYSVSKCTR